MPAEFLILIVTILSMRMRKGRLSGIKLCTNRRYRCGKDRWEADFIQALEVNWEAM